MNKELIDYIKQVRAQGFDKATITKHLLEHGYTQDVIDNAFSDLTVDKKSKKKIPLSLFIGLAVVGVLIIIVGVAYLLWPTEAESCQQTVIDIYELNDGPVLCVYPDQSKIQYIIENNGQNAITSVDVTIDTEKGKVKDTLENVDIGTDDVFTYISNLDNPSLVESVSFTPYNNEGICKSKKISFESIKIC